MSAPAAAASARFADAPKRRRRAFAVIVFVVVLDLLGFGTLLGGAVAWTVFGVAGALWLVFVARIVAGAAGGNIATA